MNRLHHLLPHLALLFLPLRSSYNALLTTAANLPSAPLFRGRLERLQAGEQAVSTGEPVRRRAGVRAVYARKQCRPLWVPEVARSWCVAINASQKDGLHPTIINTRLVFAWNVTYVHKATLLLDTKTVR